MNLYAAMGASVLLLLAKIEMVSSFKFTSAENRLSGPREPLIVAKTTLAKVGETIVHISCPLTENTMGGLERYSVIWILDKGNLVITAASNQNEKYGLIEQTGQLLIKNASRKDSGIYRCLVLNKATCSGSNYSTTAVELIVSNLSTERGSPSHHGRSPYPTTEEEYDKDESMFTNEDGNQLARAIMAGVAAFIFFCISCALYNFRWKPPIIPNHLEHPISNNRKGSSDPHHPKIQSSIVSSSSPLLPSSSSQKFLPPTNRIYLLPGNNNTTSDNILNSPPPPNFLSSSSITTPPIITTTVELTTIPSKKLVSRRRDGSERTIFLQPPSVSSSTTCSSTSTILSGPSPSPCNNQNNKKYPLLYPPPPPPPQKLFLATPESSSSSLNVVVVEEEKYTGNNTAPPFKISKNLKNNK